MDADATPPGLVAGTQALARFKIKPESQNIWSGTYTVGKPQAEKKSEVQSGAC